MKRVQGSKGVALVECINRYIGKYRVRWDIQPYTNDEGKEQGVSYFETEIILKHKPGMNDIKQAVLDGINRMTDEKILSEYVWNEHLVWLSSENQFNYKAAYDLAVQTGGASLPVTFKFGTDENVEYHTFETLEEIQEFYLSTMKYINDTLVEGWRLKDSFDWEYYNRFLP